MALSPHCLPIQRANSTSIGWFSVLNGTYNPDSDATEPEMAGCCCQTRSSAELSL